MRTFTLAALIGTLVLSLPTTARASAADRDDNTPSEAEVEADAEARDESRDGDSDGASDDDRDSPVRRSAVPYEVQGRLYGMFQWQNIDKDAAEHGFTLERARLEFTFFPVRWIEGTIEAALDDIDETGAVDDLLRDAFVVMKTRKWLGFRVGQFKKPFSLMELKSKGKLPIVTRGLSNDFLVRELGYGGRDIGAQIEGRLLKSIKLEYSLGVFNGNGANNIEDDTSGAKDAAGRLEAEPVKFLKIGLNGSIKNFDLSVPANDGKPATAWMTGGDLQFKLRDFRLQFEGLYGMNHLSTGHPMAASTHALATWKFKLPRRGMSLQPVARFDMLWPVFSENKDRAWMATVGLNWQIAAHVRLMVDLEITRSDDTLSTLWIDGEQVFVQLALDL